MLKLPFRKVLHTISKFIQVRGPARTLGAELGNRALDTVKLTGVWGTTTLFEFQLSFDAEDFACHS